MVVGEVEEEEEMVVGEMKVEGKSGGREDGGDNRPALARPRSTARGKFTNRTSIKRSKTIRRLFTEIPSPP